jgi:xylose isomerase
MRSARTSQLGRRLRERAASERASVVFEVVARGSKELARFDADPRVRFVEGDQRDLLVGRRGGRDVVAESLVAGSRKRNVPRLR